MNRPGPGTRRGSKPGTEPGTGLGTELDDVSLECLASSLLCDDPPPPTVHEEWRRAHSAEDADAEAAAVLRFPGRDTAAWRPPAAAAAAAVVLLAGGMWLAAPGAGESPAGVVGDGSSSSTSAQTSAAQPGPARPGPAQPEVDLAALGPAAGAAMGADDFGGLLDPSLAGACLAEHGESENALFGAAPMAHGDRVGQLFVLSSGMHGRVSVLLTVNTCGREPAPPVVHETIGAPG